MTERHKCSATDPLQDAVASAESVGLVTVLLANGPYIETRASEGLPVLNRDLGKQTKIN